MGSTLRRMQPTLIHVPIDKDVVFTPRWLSAAMIDHFNPCGRILDPCAGDGSFFDQLPVNADWCEIERGRDFFQWSRSVDYVIGNPPYSCLLEWIRHSMKISTHVIYLLPLHRVVASWEFLRDVEAWGGVVEEAVIGTGSSAGFPFGHALAAVHFMEGYSGGTRRHLVDWSDPVHQIN